MSFVELNLFKKAITDFNHSIKLDDKNIISYQDRGTAYLQSHQFEKAINDLKKVLKHQPDNKIVIHNLYLAMQKKQ